MSRIRQSRFLPLLAGLALTLAFAAPAAAGPALVEGDAAVDFEGKEFINTESISLRALRGKIVLMELFSTG